MRIVLGEKVLFNLVLLFGVILIWPRMGVWALKSLHNDNFSIETFCFVHFILLKWYCFSSFRSVSFWLKWYHNFPFDSAEKRLTESTFSTHRKEREHRNSQNFIIQMYNYFCRVDSLHTFISLGRFLFRSFFLQFVAHERQKKNCDIGYEIKKEDWEQQERENEEEKIESRSREC